MKTATIYQAENGMYHGEVLDEWGDVESAIVTTTAADVHRWAWEHGCKDLKLG